MPATASSAVQVRPEMTTPIAEGWPQASMTKYMEAKGNMEVFGENTAGIAGSAETFNVSGPAM
eukprot:5469610-Prorocentrum_lima.AAC.1